MGHKPGKAILVSGHDLGDLAALLEQTAGLGINIYTHGEMPAGPRLSGTQEISAFGRHFGGAWQDQQREFAAFPGAILMTTNCLMPAEGGLCGPPVHQRRGGIGGVLAHAGGHRFEAVIAAALAAPGFTDASEERWHTAGFGHHAGAWRGRLP